MSPSQRPDPDELLLQRARAGQRQAQEQLVQRFEAPVYTLCLRLTGHRELARDAAQETFLRMFRQLSDWRGQGAFWAWLKTIAVRVALAMNRQQPEQAIDGEGLDDLASEAPELPLCLSDQRALAAALAQLPAITRAVLWLHLVEGMSHQQIATLHGQSVSFSKSQLLRGLQRLRQRLLPTAGTAFDRSWPAADEATA